MPRSGIYESQKALIYEIPLHNSGINENPVFESNENIRNSSGSVNECTATQ